MSYTNQYTVAGFPYSRTGTFGPQGTDQWTDPENFYGNAEDIYLLTVTPGQIISFDYQSDCVAPGMVLYNNPITYHRYNEIDPAVVAPYGIGTPVYFTFFSPFGSPSPASLGAWYYGGTFPLLSLGLRQASLWIVPAGVTTARLSVYQGSATNFTYPCTTLSPVPRGGVNPPINYSISMAIVVPASGSFGNTAY